MPQLRLASLYLDGLNSATLALIPWAGLKHVKNDLEQRETVSNRSGAEADRVLWPCSRQDSTQATCGLRFCPMWSVFHAKWAPLGQELAEALQLEPKF